ncbi:RNA-directed DNA polymerase, eukaryota, reverse transcriptase zinc-binding domain protein [Tanacetum coccineum]
MLRLEKKNRAFRFSNYLTDKREFISVVKKGWERRIEGCKMYILMQKIKNLKKDLKKLSWKNGNVSERVVCLKEELKLIQSQFINNVHDADIRKKVAAKLSEYNEAVDNEIKLIYQLAKVEWLQEGDKNTAYFHQVIKERKHKSFIGDICDEHGIRHSGNEVPQQFVTHFKNFLGISRESDDINNAQELFTQKVLNNEGVNLCKDVTIQEIEEALKSIDDNKAPGFDGFTTKFFKATWDIIGSDVFEAIKEFFQNGKMLGEVNATIISLVPKINTPTKVSDFRPIACCNVIYKIISKVLTSRMKSVLCRIVSQNQSTFIPERSITDNILLTQELLKGYGCKQGKQRCAFKIDIMKTYDTVS